MKQDSNGNTDTIENEIGNKGHRCLIVNLAGAPGCGKSTGAAYVFSKLKMRGINAELITEYAKKKVWEKNPKAIRNQAYIFGKQYYSMTSCQDEVDVIITDSPLFLSAYYNQSDILGEAFNNMVWNVFDSYDNMTFLLKRVKEYNPLGRLQSEEESDVMYSEIQALLDQHDEIYETISGENAGYERIAEKIIEVMREYSKTK